MDVSYSLPKVSDQLLVLKEKVHNRVQPTQLIEGEQNADKKKMTKNFKTPLAQIVSRNNYHQRQNLLQYCLKLYWTH